MVASTTEQTKFLQTGKAMITNTEYDLIELAHHRRNLNTGIIIILALICTLLLSVAINLARIRDNLSEIHKDLQVIRQTINQDKLEKNNEMLEMR